jgi:hypothetical protein
MFAHLCLTHIFPLKCFVILPFFSETHITIFLLLTQFAGLVDPTVVGDMLMKNILVIEGVQLLQIYVIETCIHHHPLLAQCGLSLEEILTRNLQLPKITEGMPLISALMENIVLVRMTANLVGALFFSC